MSLDFELL
jgi:hypothetical protein